ncbi:MAG TPA: ABC transporter permease [Candidatus Didemnitutus sp.]|nr:ABC transporter permease [Candidatus Didemnitutus sp.]
MNVVLTLLRKDFALLARNRGALVLAFIVPMIVIYIVGLVFGLGRADSGPSGIPLAVVNQSDSPAAAKLVEALQAEKSFRLITTINNPDKTSRPLTEADLEPMIRDRKFSYAVVLPADLVSDSRLGLHLKVLSDPRNDIESQMVDGILEKTIFSNVPQLLGQSLQARARSFLGQPQYESFNRDLADNIARRFGGDADKIRQRIESGDFGLDRLGGSGTGSSASSSNSSGGTGDLFSRVLAVDRVQVVGKEVKSPAATRIIGGYAVMFLLFALSNSSSAFFEEKNTGIFQRVLSGPVSRGQLLWSRFLYGVLFGLMQLMALFFAGKVLYGVDVTAHFGPLIVVCLCVAGACTAFGMLLATVTKSAQAANSLATLLVITMSACGGAWFPVSFMPVFMQQVAKFTLVYWSIEGFNAVLWAGNGLGGMLPILGILVAFIAAAMGIAVWKFNRSSIFD